MGLVKESVYPEFSSSVGEDKTAFPTPNSKGPFSLFSISVGFLKTVL